jgi:hypothetical protein
MSEFIQVKYLGIQLINVDFDVVLIFVVLWTELVDVGLVGDNYIVDAGDEYI